MTETVQPSPTDDLAADCAVGPCEALAGTFRALGHPARLAILKRLAGQQEACCGEIVDALPLAQSTVSQHLQVLKEAGLLVCDARGRSCHYQLDWEKLAQAEQDCDEFWFCLRAVRPSVSQESGSDKAE